MPKTDFACNHHFRHVVTNSAGTPTCRACGMAPTEEEAKTVPTLIDWEKARQRIGSANGRGASSRRGR